MVDKKTQGKRNRAAGQRFELKVRKDLEDKGWIVSKWMNNVEFSRFAEVNDEGFKFEVEIPKTGKLNPVPIDNALE